MSAAAREQACGTWQAARSAGGSSGRRRHTTQQAHQQLLRRLLDAAAALQRLAQGVQRQPREQLLQQSALLVQPAWAHPRRLTI